MQKLFLIKPILTLLVCAFYATAQAATPVFGVSGSYPGKIFYSGTEYEAELKALHTNDGTVRGIINTKIEYQDENGNHEIGTDLFFKGTVDSGLLATIEITDHHCSMISDVCKLDKKPIAEGTISFVKVGGGSDYALFGAQIVFDSEAHSAPFDSGIFTMTSTTSFETQPQDPYFGVWSIEGYGAGYLIYPTAPPAYDAANLTLFSIDAEIRHNIFQYNQGLGWSPATHVFPILNSNTAEHSVTLGWLWWKYEIKFKDGFLYGLIRSDSQQTEPIDFEGLLFGVYE